MTKTAHSKNLAKKSALDDQIWTKKGSDWPQMGQIRDFFRSDFSTFWRSKIGQIGPKWDKSGTFQT